MNIIDFFTAYFNSFKRNSFNLKKIKKIKKTNIIINNIIKA